MKSVITHTGVSEGRIQGPYTDELFDYSKLDTWYEVIPERYVKSLEISKSSNSWVPAEVLKSRVGLFKG